MGAVRLPSPAYTQQEKTHPVAADALRAVAIGMVGWFHIWQQSWQGAGQWTYLARTGAVWVDGMILLSAFCLFLPRAAAWAEHQPDPGMDVADFYKKRAIRILPSYNVLLLTSLTVTLLTAGGGPWLWRDLAAHLTFTHAWFVETSIGTQLGSATWTLSLFAWFYLAFPLVAKAMYRRPLATGLAFFAVQAVWRSTTEPLYGTLDYNMRFNQLPAFASTLALGMWGAMAFSALIRSPQLAHWWARILCTLGGCAALWRVDGLLRDLNYSRDYQLWQLQNRTPLVSWMLLALVLLALGLPLPGARFWAFLSGISYNFYLWHQTLTVWVKYHLHLPFWQGDAPPNQLGDTVWMAKSNLLYWAAALAAAVAMTYLVEKPCVRIYKNHSKKPNNCGTQAQKVV